MKRFLQAMLVAGMVSALAGSAFAGSVLDALGPGDHLVTLTNSGTSYAHQDGFATSSVTPAGAGESNVGAVVVDGTGKIVRATVLQNSIVFGGGKIIFDVDGTQVNDGITNSNELTFAFGNLFETTIAYTGGDAISATGAVSSTDSLTGLTPGGTGNEFTDSNLSGTIDIGAIFDLDGTYGDYNRTAGNLNDRPFLAIWEDTTPDFTPQQTPSTDADGDTAPGVKVDNYWVGDPNAPVDMDNSGLEANAVKESDPNLVNFSFGGLLALFVFDTVPVQDRIASITSIHTTDPAKSEVGLYGRNAAGTEPLVGTDAKVELIGGRLFSILAGGSNTLFVMSGGYIFDPTDNSIVTVTMEFKQGPILEGRVSIVPEPTSIALLLSSVLGLGGVRVWRRKK